jgi:hypothetical protein
MRADGIIDHREADALRRIAPCSVGEPAARLENTISLRGCLVGIGNVRQTERIQHCGELAVRKRQHFGVALDESNFRIGRFCEPDLRRGKIEAGRVRTSVMGRRGDIPRPARDVENLVAALEACGVEKIGNAPDRHLPHIFMVRVRCGIVGPAGLLELPECAHRFLPGKSASIMPDAPVLWNMRREAGRLPATHCNEGDIPWPPASATSRFV